MISEEQRDRGHDILERSVAAGARIVEGGTYDGLFYRPTVVVDVTPEMPVWSEEIFAPVAPVMAAASDEEEALALHQRHRLRPRERRPDRVDRARPRVRRAGRVRDGPRQRLDLPGRGASPSAAWAPRASAAARAGRQTSRSSRSGAGSGSSARLWSTRTEPNARHAVEPEGPPAVSRDLLVIGGGIAGTSAALRAAGVGRRRGCNPRTPGSAARRPPRGILWTAPDRETLRRVCPRADGELGGVLVDEYDGAVEQVRAASVEVSEGWTGQMGFGVATGSTSMPGSRRRGSGSRGGRSGSRFIHAARELIVEGGEVRGARASGGGDGEIRAGAVVLATGGFRGSADLVRRLVGVGAERMPSREPAQRRRRTADGTGGRRGARRRAAVRSTGTCCRAHSAGCGPTTTCRSRSTTRTPASWSIASAAASRTRHEETR